METSIFTEPLARIAMYIVGALSFIVFGYTCYARTQGVVGWDMFTIAMVSVIVACASVAFIDKSNRVLGKYEYEEQ